MKEKIDKNKKKWLQEIATQKEIQSTLKAIIHSTDDAISVVDENGLQTIINTAYTHLTGLIEDDVLGKSPTIDISDGGESMLLKVLRTKKPVHGIKMRVGPNRKEVIVNVSPVMVDGILKGSVAVIHDVSEIKYLSKELERVKQRVRDLESKYTFKDIVGSSRGMIVAKEQAKKAAETPATVLLHGESGTGKELFAHAIHHASKRKNRQFIRVNCSALVDTLLESELFGYEGGSFTGAKKTGKKGLFEEADKGTIFLDEIGMMSLNLQAKLLRVLQEKEIVRVGGRGSINVDVRVISATNINLKHAVKEGRFREDLYYRLYVIPIYIPPLRERKEDLPLLVNNLIRKYNQDFGRNIKDILPEALNLLSNYFWPGNVRELENVIERAIINMKLNEETIFPKHIPILIGLNNTEKNQEKPINDSNQYNLENQKLDETNLKDIKNKTERAIIVKALKSSKGNNLQAAKKLGISLRTFYYKIKKYNIKKIYEYK
ncbi:MAG: sigma 54-interacting transcriptional regulator [Candidatus Caldatribacteriota bacterium]|nr:sigma 54-interacting transcriptional regulator [Candidatus Caldatribacteriota bacterium]